jgi:hypothetical protein
MSSSSQEPSTPPLLGAFISLLGILGIFLYFTGWIYRWAYFGFFELEITALNFPLESFLIVPIQVLLGDILIFSRAVVAVAITVGLIQITLWLLSPIAVTNSNASHSQLDRLAKKLHKCWLFKELRSFARLVSFPLLREMAIVAWILFVLFWVAYWQGTADARRDAVNQTSTRPLVTLVSSSDKIALGRNLEDLLTDPSRKGYRIIGDVEQFQQIFGRETNDTSNPNQPIVWRLLVENNNWVYLFPTLPLQATANQRPPVLAINTGDGRVQLLILSRPRIHP